MTRRIQSWREKGTRKRIGRKTGTRRRLRRRTGRKTEKRRRVTRRRTKTRKETKTRNGKEKKRGPKRVMIKRKKRRDPEHLPEVTVLSEDLEVPAEKGVGGRVEVLLNLQKHPKHQRESPLGLRHRGEIRRTKRERKKGMQIMKRETASNPHLRKRVAKKKMERRSLTKPLLH